MKKTTKILIALILTSQVAMAVQVYSTEKLNDGTYIRKCRYSNGKIDYCTQQDALKSIEVFNNPWKYMTPAQKAQWEKNNKEAKAREIQEKAKQEATEKARAKADAMAKAQKKATEEANARAYAESKAREEAELASIVTSKKLISSKVEEYKSELNKLQDKEAVGISVNTRDKELLEYKLNKLSSAKSSDLELTYKRAKEYYADGKISKQDFEESINALRYEDNKIIIEYNQITTLTSVPSQANIEVARKQKNDVNYYTDPKSPLNILNTTTNTIQAGKNLMDQVRMLGGF